MNSREIQSTKCSCPIGGGCKHAVALMLTWVHEPELFEERVAVVDRLNKLSKSTLVSLVQTMLDHAPELENLLDIPLPGTSSSRTKKLSKTAVRKQVQQALRLHEGDWYNVGPVVNALEKIVTLGHNYAQAREWQNAQLVYQVLITDILAGDEYLNGHDGEILNELREAALGLVECIPKMAGNTTQQHEAMKVVFKVIITDIELGGYSISDGLDDLLVKYIDVDGRQWMRH